MDECFECGEKAFHYHHVVPTVLGGTKTLPLCEKCHGLVHDKNFLNHKQLTKTGLENNKKQNKRFSRYAPYGYKFENDKIVVDVNEQLVIEKIKDLYIKGNGSTEIANILKSENICNREGTFYSAQGINHLLNKIGVR